MSMLKEFREFAIKGNAVDLAVGVVIGAAFGKIVSSLVEDLIMPPLGLIVGKLDFTNLYVPLSEKVQSALLAAQTTGSAGLSLADAKKLGPVLAYGSFLTILLDFVIVAFCIFLLVKGINRLKRLEAATPPPPSHSEVLLTEIRDALRSKNGAP